MNKIIKNAIKELGLGGRALCVHASLRSFGQNVTGLLDSFLEEGCTVMVPSFTDMFEALPVKEYMPENNGAGDYSYFFEKEYEDAGVFDTGRNELTVEEMGKFPMMVLENPDRKRGNNYLNSFAAVGPEAEKLVGGQSNEDVYAPIEKLYEMDGYVLLMGVGLDSATAIHFAEQKAGRAPFIRWAKGKNGTVPVRTGGCSEGFEKLYLMLKAFEKQIKVGESLWRCYRVRDLVDTAAEAFVKDPYVAHCGDSECSRCNDAAKGGPKVDFVFVE